VAAREIVGSRASARASGSKVLLKPMIPNREAIMLVKQAKAVARQWVNEEASTLLGFSGAFYHGSTTWFADDAVLPATSDVDLVVALAGPTLPVNPGKFLYRHVLLDVSYLAQNQLQAADVILGQSDMAGSLRIPSIIADPSGQLTILQAAVARDYAKLRWVRRRCEHARDKILRNLESLPEAAPFHDQVTAWLFATGVTTHVLLVAGLKNPTVRQRYLATCELLAEYGHVDFYESLLELLGCAQMSQARAEQHLAALTEAFDAAKAVVRTPFFFAADISDTARPIAIDGSRALIERGCQREAIFWMVATYSRCQKVLYQDAPLELQERYHPGYWDLLADLGIRSTADLRQRGEQVREFLPRLWEVAEAILAANPGIDDRPGTRI
jgi:hypothetical protein